jgi:hypothetical protein
MRAGQPHASGSGPAPTGYNTESTDLSALGAVQPMAIAYSPPWHCMQTNEKTPEVVRARPPATLPNRPGTRARILRRTRKNGRKAGRPPPSNGVGGMQTTPDRARAQVDGHLKVQVDGADA